MKKVLAVLLTLAFLLGFAGVASAQLLNGGGLDVDNIQVAIDKEKFSIKNVVISKSGDAKATGNVGITELKNEAENRAENKDIKSEVKVEKAKKVKVCAPSVIVNKQNNTQINKACVTNIGKAYAKSGDVKVYNVQAIEINKTSTIEQKHIDVNKKEVNVTKDGNNNDGNNE